MKKVIVATVVMAAAGLSAAVYFRAQGSGAEPTITTAPVTRGSIVQAVQATGALEAVTTVQVGTQVSGTILTLGADYNSIVHKGQVIATLDPSLLETQIEQARATLAKLDADVERTRVQVEDAERKLSRARELAAKQLIPASDLDTAQVEVRSTQAQLKSAEAQVVQAQASLNQAQVNLDHTIIRAPIDGIVISRNVEVGQTVAASMASPTLFVIAEDLTSMRANAAIDESDVGVLRPGQAVVFTVDAYPGRTFAGTVSQIRLQPAVVQNVVTYTTVIDVPNPELKLKPGMTANVTVEVARRDQVVRISNQALRFKPSEQMLTALGSLVAAQPAQLPESIEDLRSVARSAPAGGVWVQPVVATAAAVDWKAVDSVDALFRPAVPSSSSHVVWVLTDRQLTPVPVTLGISDGAYTELVAGDVNLGSALVTSVVIESASKAAAASVASPLTPAPPRPGGGR